MQPEIIESTHFSPVVVAPTFNNAATLADLIAAVRAIGLPLIVVNDGSTDGTAQILREANFSPSPMFWVISHDKNLGKAAALRAGFLAAQERGYTHALTIDTNGQHDPNQIQDLLTASRHHPRALVLGMRAKHAPYYSLGARIGRFISNLLVRAECHRRVLDTQCGLRVYPLSVVRAVHCYASRFGYETEILTRAAWTGVPFLQLPVHCRYFPRTQRVSHFHPVGDSARAVTMHARLLMHAMSRWPGHFGRWISPLRAWRDLRSEQTSRGEFAAGVAVGVFIACLPAYGLQSVLCLLAARRFSLNPLSVIAGSQLSLPPITPFLIASSLALGHLLIHGALPHIQSWTDLKASIISPVALRGWLLDWIIGGPLLGLVLALAAYVVFRVMFHFVTAPQCPQNVNP